jgi:hypothetical protein
MPVEGHRSSRAPTEACNHRDSSTPPRRHGSSCPGPVASPSTLADSDPGLSGATDGIFKFVSVRRNAKVPGTSMNEAAECQCQWQARRHGRNLNLVLKLPSPGPPAERGRYLSTLRSLTCQWRSRACCSKKTQLRPPPSPGARASLRAFKLRHTPNLTRGPGHSSRQAPSPPTHCDSAQPRAALRCPASLLVCAGGGFIQAYELAPPAPGNCTVTPGRGIPADRTRNRGRG